MRHCCSLCLVRTSQCWFTLHRLCALQCLPLRRLALFTCTRLGPVPEAEIAASLCRCTGTGCAAAVAVRMQLNSPASRTSGTDADPQPYSLTGAQHTVLRPRCPAPAQVHRGRLAGPWPTSSSIALALADAAQLRTVSSELRAKAPALVCRGRLRKGSMDVAVKVQLHSCTCQSRGLFPQAPSFFGVACKRKP